MISIITTSFNSAKTIEDTLRSVAAQTYSPIEHLVVDGNSTDDTLKIVQQFSHVSKCISEPDNGLYDAMNKGIQLANGEVIGILNSDDFYTNDQVLEQVMQCFEDPTVDVVYGDLDYVHPIKTTQVIRRWRAGTYTEKSFYNGWMPPHPAFFVRRRVYEKYGLFDLRLRSSADYEFMLRILLKNNVPSYYLPQRLVNMRTGGASNSNLGRRLNAHKEDRLAWQLLGLQPFFFTLWLKKLRKVGQYL